MLRKKEKMKFLTLQPFIVQIYAKYIFSCLKIENKLSLFSPLDLTGPKKSEHPSNYLLELQLILVNLLA